MSKTEQFAATFEQLKGLLQPFAPKLKVEADTPGNYVLNTPYVAQYQKELLFGGVQIKKNYVSYHLFPVYVRPELLDEISPALKQRMQGKSCFNFARIEPALLDELAQLTARGYALFEHEYGL